MIHDKLQESAKPLGKKLQRHGDVWYGDDGDEPVDTNKVEGYK